MTTTTTSTRFSQYQERMFGRHSAKSFSENVETEKVIKILKSYIIFYHCNKLRVQQSGKGVLPIMTYTGRLRRNGVPFSGFRYKKG